MLVVANFKMNGNKNFFLKLNETYEKLKIKGTNVVLCPPFVYLSNLNIKNKNVCLGAQDISIVGNNKSTGQIGAYMLKEFNVKYCIIGHSERRAIGETGEMIAKKVKSACENKIIPIICVGEATKQDKSSAVKNQVKSALKYLQPGSKIIFAYEPVWAIGSGQVPTIKHINNKIKTIKAEANALGFSPKILYGGSVNDNNFLQLKTAEIDGFLVGGLSLDTNKFCKLIMGV